MDLKTFLIDYRKGVKAAKGKHLSRKTLIEKIFKKNPEEVSKIEKKWEKWETGAGKPKEEEDRLAIKVFFGLDSFENIDQITLQEAIDRYPEGLGEIHDIIPTQPVDNQIPKTNIGEKINDELPNGLNSQSTNSQDDMNSLNAEMVRYLMKSHAQLIDTVQILARKVPDVEQQEMGKEKHA